MAWEEEQEGSAEISSAGLEQPKKSPIKLIVFIVIGLLVVGGIGFGVKMFFFNKSDDKKVEETTDSKEAKKDEEKKEKGKEGEEEVKEGVILGLDPFIVNLSGNDGRRYLKINIRLELDSKPLMEAINSPTSPLLFKTKDAILEILSSKSVEEVLPVDNRRDLRNEIKFRLNRIYEKSKNKGKVTGVYFTEFLVD